MLPAWIVAVALGGQPQADLVAAAAATGRPAECWPRRARAGSTDASVWQAAGVPGLTRYCALVARGQARLALDPAGARTAAEQAEALLPGHAAPLVLLARVALRLGQLDEASALFARAIRLDRRALDQPLALLDLASTLRRTGRLDEALRTYRELVPRAALLPDRATRARALLEAAHVALAMATDEADRPRLDEAAAYLREAAQDPHQPYRADVALTLALALDRAGHTGQADALLTELPLAGALATGDEPSFLAQAADGVALQALAAAARDAPRAAALWRQVLASVPAGSLAERAAAARLARLGGAGRAGRPGVRR